MYSVPSLTNAGDVGSHAVYPRAADVARVPPEGKLDASGSPTIRFLPVSCMMTLSPEGSIKLSCFSAVRLVRGWNQCV